MKNVAATRWPLMGVLKEIPVAFLWQTRTRSFRSDPVNSSFCSGELIVLVDFLAAVHLYCIQFHLRLRRLAARLHLHSNFPVARPRTLSFSPLPVLSPSNPSPPRLDQATDRLYLGSFSSYFGTSPSLQTCHARSSLPPTNALADQGCSLST